MSVPNRYPELLEVGESTGLFAQSKDVHTYPDLEDREVFLGQLMEEVIRHYRLTDTNWYLLDKTSKPGSNNYNGHALDCIGYMDGGTFVELDVVYDACSSTSKLQWDKTPEVSKWKPGIPGGVATEPPPSPATGDDMHYAINEDLTSRALDELDALNKKHWLVDRAPNPSISRYIFGIYEPNMQTELNKIGYLPGDPNVWETIHDQSVYKFTQQLYTDHHNAVVPGEPVPAPDPR